MHSDPQRCDNHCRFRRHQGVPSKGKPRDPQLDGVTALKLKVEDGNRHAANDEPKNRAVTYLFARPY